MTVLIIVGVLMFGFGAGVVGAFWFMNYLIRGFIDAS